LEVNSPRYRFI
jgi:hypothetical protein